MAEFMASCPRLIAVSHQLQEMILCFISAIHIYDMRVYIMESKNLAASEKGKMLCSKTQGLSFL